MAPSVLNPGDIAIVGYISNGNPDSFSFVPLVDLSAGTVIYFTDNGWKSSDSSFTTTEGTVKFTANSDITAGTIISSTDTSSFVKTGKFDLAGTGDQIAAVQSTNSTTPLSSGFTAIYQIDNTGAFEDATSSATGNVITGLSETNNTAVLFDNTLSKNAAFKLDAIPNGTRADWLAAINNSNNWTFNTNITSLPTGNITVISETSGGSNPTKLVVSNTNDTGAGSLRQAIQDANALTGATTITFDAGLSKQTITLTSGELIIKKAVTIQGLGANQLTISGNNASRIFKIDDGNSGKINVVIDDLTITGGKTPTANDNNDGGGIWNRENLTLKNVVVRNNQAADDGGGIRNDGTITIINSTIANNTSIGTTQTSGGGGLLNTNAAGASATVVNSTFSGNTARNGGGIRNDGTLNIINSTLSGNNATLVGGGGGAIANSLGNVNIQSSTIANNTAAGLGAGVSTANAVKVTNSIIAANTENKDVTSVFNGSFTSGGNNLIGNGNGISGFTNGNNGDIVGTSSAPVDPKLDSLQDNGGATQTHALMSGSPAINAGNNTKLAQDTFDLDGDSNTNEPIPVEQRGTGFERIINNTVDIGAYEYTNQAPTITANQSFSIQENSLIGTIVGQVTAIDSNGDTLSNWEIINGNSDVDKDGIAAFAIDSTTGTITVNDADDLDFETQPSFQLQVRVSDGTANSNPVIVNINLDDVKDILKGTSENDIINGGVGDDLLFGFAGNDTLNGNAGNDNLYGGAGDDSIDGGDGIDTLRETADTNFTLTVDKLESVATGIDTFTNIERVALNGGKGANTIDASAYTGITYLYGRGGNDTLIGGSGNDNLYGGAGDDSIDGGDGIDTLRETADTNFTLTQTTLKSDATGLDSFVNIERVALTGGDGDNTINASAYTGTAYLYGRGGNDTLIGGAGNDNLYGGQGDDSIDGGAGIDTLRETGDVDFTLTNNQLIGLGTDSLVNIERVALSGGDGDNKIDASKFTGSAYLYGKVGNDTLIGGTGNDNLYGGAGNDSIDGGDGIDTLRETGDVDFTLTNNQLIGLGTDTLVNIERVALSGGDGDNTINASAFSGNSYLYGKGGDDTLIGGTGNDNLYGGAGDDLIDGGDGIDTLRETGDVDFTLTNNQLTGLGTDTLVNIERVVLSGGDSANKIDAAAFSGNSYLYGKGGDDTLTGGEGNDNLDGGEGNDTLTGGGGNDLIKGGEGNDLIKGGAGNDRLYGGDGSDIFVISSFTTNGKDTIYDFADGVDTLGLSDGLTFNDLTIKASGNNTNILQGNQVLVTLIGVDSTSITGSDFTSA